MAPIRMSICATLKMNYIILIYRIWKNIIKICSAFLIPVFSYFCAKRNLLLNYNIVPRLVNSFLAKIIAFLATICYNKANV